MTAALRLYLALSLLVGAGGMLLWGHPSAATMLWRATLDVPFLVWGIFLAGACEVRVRDHRLEYRRLLGWVSVPTDSIRGLRSSWHPHLGAISLDHFVFPFGMLYVVTRDVDRDVADPMSLEAMDMREGTDFGSAVRSESRGRRLCLLGGGAV